MALYFECRVNINTLLPFRRFCPLGKDPLTRLIFNFRTFALFNVLEIRLDRYWTPSRQRRGWRRLWRWACRLRAESNTHPWTRQRSGQIGLWWRGQYKTKL